MSFDAFVATSVKEGLDIGNINAGINYLRHVEGEKHLIYVAYGGFKTSGFVGTLDSVARAASHARVALDIVHTGGIEYRGYPAQPQTIASKMGIDTDPFDAYLYGGTTIASAQTARRVARRPEGCSTPTAIEWWPTTSPLWMWGRASNTPSATTLRVVTQTGTIGRLRSAPRAAM